jgi:hypothetical protein
MDNCRQVEGSSDASHVRALQGDEDCSGHVRIVDVEHGLTLSVKLHGSDRNVPHSGSEMCGSLLLRSI